MTQPNAGEVRTIVENLLSAVASGDRQAIMENHADDLRMFDFPDIVKGLREYEAQWDFFYDSQTAPITFAPEELEVSAGGEVAFASCIVHCKGTSGGDFRFRLTIGLERREGRWLIVHEHHSLATKNAGMIMPEKRSALKVEVA